MSGDTYARAPGLWAWRILIARCGPADPVMRACLWALATILDEHGNGWATQKQIAAAACVSDRTVRDKLAHASRLHWLGMTPKGATGKQWKCYEFRACIPDGLEIPRRSDGDAFPEKVEELIDATEGTYGEVGPEWLRGSHFEQPRPEGASGHGGRAKAHGATLQRAHDRKLTTERPETDAGETGNSRQHDRKLTTERPEGASDTVSYTVPPAVSHSCSQGLVRSGDRTADSDGDKGERNTRRKANGLTHVSEATRTPKQAEPATQGEVSDTTRGLILAMAKQQQQSGGLDLDRIADRVRAPLAAVVAVLREREAAA